MSIPSPLAMILVSSAVMAVVIGGRPRHHRHTYVYPADVELPGDGSRRRLGALIVAGSALVVLATIGVLVWRYVP